MTTPYTMTLNLIYHLPLTMNRGLIREGGRLLNKLMVRGGLLERGLIREGG